MMSPEAVSSAVGRLVREWGDYGYSIESVEHGPIYGAATLHVVHSDGSRFVVACDRWGNPLDVNGALPEELAR